MKTLVVEDDPIARRVLEGSLATLGHEFVIATDGSMAWEILCRDPIRVVISDWAMPNMDGLDLCRRIRETSTKYVYFILLTNLSASAENQESALQAGVDDFLNKPVNLRELKMRLHVAERILGYTAQIQTLESFIPICSYCKKIRSDQNYWQQIESYISKRTGSRFSHSICPTCYEQHLLPELQKVKMADNLASGGGSAPG